MATTDLLHKNLTDPQLHEPKGISTADENEVYFANGEGSGEWKTIAIDLLDFNKEPVSAATLAEVPATISFTTDIVGFVQGNVATTGMPVYDANFYELTQECLRLRDSLAVAHENISALNETIESLRAALITTGVIANG